MIDSRFELRSKFQKAIFLKLAFLMVLTLFVSCPNPSVDSGNAPTIDPDLPAPIKGQFFWGRWQRWDSPSEWYISQTEIDVDGVITPIDTRDSSGESFVAGTYSVSRQSDNVITVVQGNKTLLLFRRSGSNARFSLNLSASLLTANGTSGINPRGLSNLGGIKVLIQNVKNAADKQTVTTDSTGNLETNNTIPGDPYTVSLQDLPASVVTEVGLPPGVLLPTFEVKPLFKDQSLGTLALSATAKNIKVTLEDESGYYTNTGNDGYRYPNMVYQVTLVIKNTGTADIISPRYTIVPDSGLAIVSGSSKGLLATLEPGTEKRLPVGIRASALINLERQFLGLTVYLEDLVSNASTTKVTQVWEDRTDVLFWNRTITFNVHADGLLTGMILTPERQSLRLSGKKDYTVVLPWREEDYLVAFSGATADTEATYRLGVNGDTNFATDPLILPDNNAALYEPNNDELVAANLNNTITARLTKGDYDFYRVKGTTNVYVLDPSMFSVKIKENSPTPKIAPFSIDEQLIFSGTLNHGVDRYQWYVDSVLKADNTLDLSTIIPDLVIPANSLSLNSHQVTLMVYRGSSVFSDELYFGVK